MTVSGKIRAWTKAAPWRRWVRSGQEETAGKLLQKEHSQGVVEFRHEEVGAVGRRGIQLAHLDGWCREPSQGLQKEEHVWRKKVQFVLFGLQYLCYV